MKQGRLGTWVHSHYICETCELSESNERSETIEPSEIS